MISTLGYPAPHSPPHSNTWFDLAAPSHLQLQTSLFVPSRRPSIPLSPGLLPLVSFRPSVPAHPPYPGISLQQTFKTSPVHKLPVEVLCNIFSYCEAISQNTQIGLKVIISHVCRRWRHIVLCIPLLWTSILVSSFNETTADRVSAFLRRSGTCPISLTVFTSDRPSGLDLWCLMQAYAHQVKSLRLNIRGSAQSLIHSFQQYQFPKLENLGVHLSSGTSLVATKLVTALQRHSSVVSLSWSGVAIPTSVQWSRLQQLEMHGVYTIETLSHILERCHGVSLLSLGVVTGDESANLQGQISLPNLHTLSIHSLVGLSNIYRRLYTPRLRRIRLSLQAQACLPRDWALFNQMLLQSDCKIESFDYADRLSGEHEVAQLLRLPCFKYLKDLRLRDSIITDTVLQVLTLRPPDDSSLLPLLESLCLSDVQTSDGQLGLFLSWWLTQTVSMRRLELGFDDQHTQDMRYLNSLRGRLDVFFPEYE